VIPVWESACPVAGEPAEPVRLIGGDAAKVLATATELVFLGLDGESPVFGADLSALPEEAALEASGAERLLDLRAMAGGLPAAEAATQAYARGILHWHRHQRFCGTCGSQTVSRHGGHLRACPGVGCGRELYPRIEPAVIMLVELIETDQPARCLLARHRGAGPHGFATLAGFVEIGENLEDAVRREVFEETGVRIATATYQASQAWPFPAGLMLGFRARALRADVDVDRDEIEEARWFTRADLRAREEAGHPLGRVDSIDRILLRSWLAESEPGLSPRLDSGDGLYLHR
jgi:NAD+ diphosphatase